MKHVVLALFCAVMFSAVEAIEAEDLFEITEHNFDETVAD